MLALFHLALLIRWKVYLNIISINDKLLSVCSMLFVNLSIDWLLQMVQMPYPNFPMCWNQCITYNNYFLLRLNLLKNLYGTMKFTIWHFECWICYLVMVNKIIKIQSTLFFEDSYFCPYASFLHILLEALHTTVMGLRRSWIKFPLKDIVWVH
jgi:hypothetical protein